ncbi:amino acid/amide ABC transporter substrate-binding protein, HAAT family [Desulfosporosinus acidiphilus SJ4]|uniref:Amino acid/amide ABC transporter substrate-binding protein, HAAT family n=1 Tax=Desulfosporosinus acidiphilus (strain DSM 22704 / JCM 16185 / SJ4) TaxID=646529 RepID=I4D2J9_DESAJ|nr:ABC transporter substrate-binding protein [Desulfosporosinus acidiphilus]AFM40023.1 amino acid/amide ABC transporter substrate-binding protein, HAAT family [Desulfosporosinus acidiphilus SJ4]
MVRMVGKARGKSSSLMRIGSLLLTTALLVTGCGNTPTSSSGQKAVKVGIVDTYTGGASVYAKDSLDGFKLAVKEIEAKGGPKIDFVTRDDEFKPDKATSWAKELVMRDQVDFLAGTTNSAGSLAVSQYAKENKVPFIDWGGMSDKVTGADGHRYVFSTLPNTAIIGKAGAVQISKTPYKKIWFAGSDYEYGHSVINNLWSNLQTIDPGIQKMGETWWQVGETDFTPYINAIRSKKPDLLVVGTGGADMVAFMKAVKATGLVQDIPVWAHTCYDPATLRPLGDQAPIGVLGTNPYLYNYPDTEANKAFVAAFKKEYNREPAAFALYGYMAGQFLGQAIEKAGSTDKEKIIDALEGLTIDTPVGKATIRKEDHQVEIPMSYGVIGKVDGKIGAVDLHTLSADEIMPTLDDIQKARANTKK